ncbi:DUF3537 domain-containing protein [Cephalotus follicularis]|uniref:DUF3537 domain-containing protein n=1 Tax=Cephalotus follicularis TaxID=3775 RepID=A0A1Q3BK74_CEPFO|nr:DUF3537 domain-containing protein [Cephalotus follicularis]
MAVEDTISDNATAAQTPLLQTQTQQQEQDQSETQLSKSLHYLETFLTLFGFCQYSLLSLTLSWVSFLLLGVALPVFIIYLSYCSNCDKYDVKSFELEILVSRSLVAVIALICISHNLRKYGVRKFLFVDRFHGSVTQYHQEYVQKINGFFRLLAVCLLPCFLLKTAREVFRISYEHPNTWWESVALLVALLVSWAYSNTIYISASALFNLICNLQVIHFENYWKLLERDLDVSVYIEEHIRLTHYLSKVSHRFRIYLLFELLVVTASQFVALLETTGNGASINIINGGDFAICSIVELVGLVICLHAATKITYRAQGLASVACRWHALVTCSSNDDSQPGMRNNSSGSLEGSYTAGSLPMRYSQSDLESVDYVPVPTNSQMASYTSSYQKRQAFIMYLQTNPGGATVYGWTIDRALINTIFFLEFSLVLFVLGKTITFTTK